MRVCVCVRETECGWVAPAGSKAHLRPVGIQVTAAQRTRAEGDTRRNLGGRSRAPSVAARLPPSRGRATRWLTRWLCGGVGARQELHKQEDLVDVMESKVRDWVLLGVPGLAVTCVGLIAYLTHLAKDQRGRTSSKDGTSHFREWSKLWAWRFRRRPGNWCQPNAHVGDGGGAGDGRQADTANAEVRTVNAKLKSTLTQLRSSRNLCMDITLICVVLGIAAYIYSWFS